MAQHPYYGIIKRKESFFKTYQRACPEQIQTIKEKALLLQDQENEFTYSFIAEHLTLLELDFHHMYTALKKYPKAGRHYWLYTLYCSEALKYYYISYDKEDKVKEYEEHSTAIEQQLGLPSQDERQQLPKLHPLASTLRSFIRIPLHASEIRNILGFINVTRMQLIFARLSVTFMIAIARESARIKQLLSNIPRYANVDKTLKIFDKSPVVFNILSIAVFVGRFLINAVMLFKHTFFPNEAERALNISKRFAHEFWKRHWFFANDLVWGVVNAVTNYAKFFHVSASVAGPLISIFLGFDVGMLVYRRYLDSKDYQVKQKQYILEISATEDEETRKILYQQAQACEREWQAKQSFYNFNLTAAVLLAIGFTASMLIASSFAPAVSFLVCTLGVALYLSSGAWETYQKKSLEYKDCEENLSLAKEQHNVSNNELKKLENEKDECLKALKTARNGIFLTVGKNMLLPTLLVAVCAIYWPAALALTALYIGYQIYRNSAQPIDAEEHVDDGRDFVPGPA